ncbi:hypothetical protein KAU34_05600 [candidate division WOR-3 bacterium]|nr:hypothetical protein [candidate division WOR-3 bacterium]MCK4575860.1 hypothetical protein [candidate division WOR-3 bacterium]
MLNRAQLETFMEMMFEEKRIELPEDIELEDVVEAFCQYCDDELVDWLKMRFSSFFLMGSGESSIDWNWVRQNISSL